MNNEKIIILAGLAVGAYFLATRASAAQPATRSPAASAQPTLYGNPTRSADPTAARVGAVASLIGGIANLFGGGRVSEVGDASSSVGEAAARQYYLSNLDAFAINPPSSYQTDSGWTFPGFDSQ